jgi:hypothetical protein
MLRREIDTMRGNGTLLATFMFLFLEGGIALAHDVPSYQVLKTTVPIQVDGLLNEPSWIKAKEVGAFVNSPDGSPSELKTEAKILYDEEFIYFAFRVQDQNIWSTYRERDEHLWTEEVVEVFVQASAVEPDYIELEVNPLGTMIDIYLLDIRKPLPYKSWNSEKLQWAINVKGTVDGKPGDTEWTCEMALPLEDVVTAPNLPPKPGDQWRANLYRVESKPEKAGLAWSPTMRRDFHVPSMFGKIVFSDISVP